MHRPDVGDDAHLGPGEGAELRDLPEAAHRQLEDAELGVGLDAADGERHADLGVVAPLCSNSASLWPADRSEDVLRRGLPHRAGDSDEPRAAAVADAAGDRAKSTEGVVRDECGRRSPGESMLDEVDASAHRDEEVTSMTRRESV